MTWNTIDETPSTQPVVLRGIPIETPRAYARVYGRKGGWFHVAAFMAGLWRVTSWSVSILGHLVLMIILVGIVLKKQEEKDQLVAVSTAPGNLGDNGKVLAMAKPDPAPEPKPEPVVEEKVEEAKPDEKPIVEEKKPELVEEPKPTEKEEKTEEVAKVETPVDSEKKSDVIGTGDGKPDAVKNEAGDPTKPITDATSATASRRAGDLAKLRRGGEKEIVVVAGAYDQVERVLTTLGIPHTRIDHNDLGRYDLSKCLVLLVNCHTSLAKMAAPSSTNAAKMKEEADRLARRVRDLEEKLEKSREKLKKEEDASRPRESVLRQLRSEVRAQELDLQGTRQSKSYYDRMYEYYVNAAGMIDNVRRFVEKGGYIFTSDWGLTLLEKCFPDFIANGGNFGPSVVKIAPSRAEEAASILQGVFVKKGKSSELRWEIDSGTYLIRIKSNKVVTVVESGQIPNHKAVAVAFTPAGEGRVLHVLSHFSKQEDSYGEYALQSLLLNFILERMEKKAP